MIRLGSRRSPLALVQARTVAAALRGAGHGVEIVEVVTTGDRDRAAPDKAKWVTELERGLVAGEIDLAVHSAKDVPGELPDGLELVAASVREDPRDVLIGAPSLDALPEGARVGTASLRRAAQLLGSRRDLTIVAARGNVDTRLARLQPGHDEHLDAIVLAAAGLERLGRTPADVVPLEGPVFVAAPGQGTLTIEGRAGDEASAAAARVIHDASNWACLRAERAVARALGADCTSAVGAHCRPVEGGFSLTGYVGAPDGSGWALDAREGDDPEALGALVAERLLRAGGAELLAAAREGIDQSAPIAEQQDHAEDPTS
ncbi:hydroxymethylbilane synthase [Patulibacter minatonensis]|uniref:hydroxymethylbilane synthase n=1 Tax=Patulibacter minatonensis TaxID=298163 RepID=UPI00146F98A5|nr:hydroxymethylbilane synthase [Patulibacter minatonensis]